MNAHFTKRSLLIANICLGFICLVLAIVLIELVLIGDNELNLNTESSNIAEAQQSQHQSNYTKPDISRPPVSISEQTESDSDPDVFPWSDRDIEFMNERAKTNPAVNKVLRPEEGESVPAENIINIEYLSSLKSENIELSLRYIGDFLLERGYNPKTVLVVILEGIEVPEPGDHKLFFFQVYGESTVYSVSLKDPEFNWVASVHDVADEKVLRTKNDEYKQILKKRGYL